ncbi:MAG: hypothetical protein OZSIB_2581 [Candidatus Ozemobacter sibiricus]|uniref:6-bladed beta-propeller n=1 Tax=Candidatus Ozemobacter sibiricus TaxID=2268124 RepID=A0A367ZK96_9BACT|nr:MAG: hypothetical protein OZSIB_2581 [Candidatus Ozemobacter sibiricus]
MSYIRQAKRPWPICSIGWGFFLFLGIAWAGSEAVQILVRFGTGPGQVSFINARSHPGHQIPIPYGPRAFRIVGDACWIIDTVGGKLLKFDLNGAFLDEHRLTDQPDSLILEDLTPIFGPQQTLTGWWTIDGRASELLRLDPQGAIRQRLAIKDAVQPFRVETGPAGEVYLADKGARAIFQIDPGSGAVIRKTPWEWSGLAVGAKSGNLYLLRFSATDRRSVLVSLDRQGRPKTRIVCDFPPHYNPDLVCVDEQRQEFVLTYLAYAPGHPSHHRTVALRCGWDGKIKGSAPLPADTGHLHRPLEWNGGSPYVATADYGRAPAGALRIARFFLP